MDPDVASAIAGYFVKIITLMGKYLEVRKKIFCHFFFFFFLFNVFCFRLFFQMKSEWIIIVGQLDLAVSDSLPSLSILVFLERKISKWP